MTAATAPPPPSVSGGQHEHGHLEELRGDPIGLMRRVHDECGDVGAFDLAGRRVVLVSGADLNEWYFRTPDELLDQGAAYPFMTPIFGTGVVFDAPPERRGEMLKNSSLRGPQMKGHAEVIAAEVERSIAGWSREQTIDLLDFFAELTIYTSSSCLIGKKFREQLDGSFARLYHDLERGTDALAYVDAYAPIDSFRRRDEARVELVKLVEGIMAGRADGERDEDSDLLDLLMSLKHEDGRSRFSADEITGIFISMMFAGHHTTSGTAAWTLIELLRKPAEMAAVVSELDELYAGGGTVSFQALREIPRLEAAIKEALRLHPPLILLLRVATQDMEVGGYLVREGDLVAASPAISNRLAPDFVDPDAFEPVRYLDPRREDDHNPWTWIPFGGGKHRCVGAAFAMMQLKAIFLVLLRGYEFELAQPTDTYRNDHSKMVVQLEQPCAVHVRRRSR
ncbi:MAG TPA: cytochrome P450 [Mycobacteriales bacterium]|jgi:sterol 14-demethylase|nr:cytochrome P450 [Mycobacteriales bacterium]